jgi:hypothetical protein
MTRRSRTIAIPAFSATRMASSIPRRFAIGVVAILLLPVIGVAGMLVAWLTAFVDPAPQQDDCSFNSVDKSEYQRLLGLAKAQDWTVWPGLSKGLFWPSEEPFAQPMPAFERALGDHLLQSIEKLAVDATRPDHRLAAAHAVMRSIRAEYVNVWDIPDFRENGRLVRTYIHFNYFTPQRRFAPLCLHCLVRPYTTMSVIFRHEIEANTYTLERVNVLNGGLKYDPKKERNSSDVCPAFPKGK